MEKFITHTGIGVPLRRSNVDTDQIIPAVYLKRVTRTGFEDALFAAWRGDPEFVLNQDAYKNGTVLIAGPDFGTGSSREHAGWALEAEPGTEVTVSLEDKTWRAGAISGTFQIDDYVRWTLMEGLDDIALTLRHEDEIAAYEAARPSFKPRTLPAKFLPKEEVVSARD